MMWPINKGGELAPRLARCVAEYLRDGRVYVVLEGEDSAFSILDMDGKDYAKRERPWIEGPAFLTRWQAEAYAQRKRREETERS